jgi:hypothetical protein
MYFAQAVPVDGEVVSIEKFDKIARRNFELNGLSSKIKLFDGDAFQVIDRLPGDQLFDLVFIDGNQERYKDYVVKTEPLLAKNGIMIVDDCFYHGDVLNAQPSDAKASVPRPAWIISPAPPIGCESRCRCFRDDAQQGVAQFPSRDCGLRPAGLVSLGGRGLLSVSASPFPPKVLDHCVDCYRAKNAQVRFPVVQQKVSNAAVANEQECQYAICFSICVR